MNQKITSELINGINIPLETNMESFPISSNVNQITSAQKKLLKSYKDRSLIVSILSKRSYEFFSSIKSLVNIPLILSSTTLAILNSAPITTEQMKLPNIIINSITGLTLAMISNFKINEKTTVFQNISKKMNKLNHKIEEAFINDIDNLDTDKITNFIREYESLIDQLDYNFPTSVKRKVYDKYKNTNLTLPNTLIGIDDINISDLNANNINGVNNV
tara:strand:+ start:839 stop:1489 length:651 start_codon:yes stop_codon:yes gene_type:complete